MRRVAVIGCGGGMMDIPAGFERWGLPWSGDSSYDLYFEMHGKEDPRIDDAYRRNLKDLEVPILAREKFDDVPNLKEYPQGAVDGVGGYIESSIGYILAYAIHEGVDEIFICGVGAPFDHHYHYQRGNIEYLIGLARGKGITVNVHEDSELLSSCWPSGIYGFKIPEDYKGPRPWQ